MKNKILGHLEHLKEQPHHARRQMVISMAGTISVFIGVIWLSSSLLTGAFEIHMSSFAMLTNGSGVATTSASAPDTGSASGSGLAGAAAAIPGVPQPAKITVVDTASKATTTPAQKSVLPF